MNKIYRLIWNALTQTWVAVAEVATGRGKGDRRSSVFKTGPPPAAADSFHLTALALCLVPILNLPAWAQTLPPASLAANALPTGGSVIAGAASISQAANTLTVNQASQRAALDWQSFNIGTAATVNFKQPNANAVALNRITGNSVSEIYGKLNANGHVFFSNPSGWIFGKDAQINVGSLMATTLNISNTGAFANGDTNTLKLSGGAGNTGSIRNEGLLAATGSVALVGNTLQNTGQIIATTATLAAGNTVALDLSGDGLIRVRVTDPTLQASLENSGSITASQAVTMTAGQARAAIHSVVNNTGVIRATGLVNRGGEIYLEGRRTLNSGGLDTSSSTGQGGKVQMLGQEVGITGNGSVNASGATGGGEILVGGDYQGKNPDIQNASFSYVGADTSLNASALHSGDGGKVIVWADNTTRAYGSITAKGGANGGNGGLVETSGKNALDVAGARVSASAPLGKNGRWLLDPTDVTIVHGNASALSGGLFDPFSNSSIGDNQINAALAGGTDVTIQTSAGIGSSFGSIVVNGTGDSGGAVAISNNGGGARSLSLITGGTIDIRSGATIGAGDTLNGGSFYDSLNVNLNAANGINIAGTIDNKGGTTTLTTAFGGTTTLSGALKNGTLYGGSDTANLTSNFGTLDGMTLSSNFNLTGSSYIKNSLLLTNGVTLSLGSNSNLYWRTLDASQQLATVSGNATVNVAGGYAIYAGDGGTGQTVTIGNGITLQGYGYITRGSAASIVNDGTIRSNTAGQTFTISPTNFTNNGTLGVTAGTMDVIATSWGSAGSGGFNVTGGTLNLGGSFNTAGIGSFSRTGGTVNLTGTLTNTASVLDINTAFGTGGLNSFSGTILGGTLGNDTANLTSNFGTLDGVTLGSNFNLTGSTYIKNSLLLTNGITLSLGNSNLYWRTLDASQQLATVSGSATVNVAGGYAIYAGDGGTGQTVTIGSGITLQGFGSITRGSAASIVNNGTIRANTAGQTFTISPTNFTNNGTLGVTAGTMNVIATSWGSAGSGGFNVTGGTLNLGGSFNTAGIGSFSRTGGTVNLTGTLTNTASVLDINTAFGTGGLQALNSGTIVGGTLTNSSVTPLMSSNFGTLDGVTLGSNLSLTGSTYIKNSLLLTNGITLSLGSNSSLYWRTLDASQQLATVSGNATVNVAGGYAIYAGDGGTGQTITIGSGITLQGYGGITQNSAASVINNGTIRANTSGQTFTINPTHFTNNYLLSANAGGRFNVASTSFSNSASGVIYVDSGARFQRTAGFTNLGTIRGTGEVVVGTGASRLVNQGIISPADAGVVGTLTITGDMEAGAGSELQLELAGTGVGQSDKLVVSGAMTGTFDKLNVDLFFSYSPANADYIPVLTAGSSTGLGFTNTTLPSGFSAGLNLAAGEAVRLIYASPGTKTFTNAAGGLDWSLPGNWSGGTLPSAWDTALLSAGYAVTHSSGTNTVAALTINTANALDVTGGSLTVSGATTLGGTLTVSGSGSATLNGALNGAASGQVNVTGGTFTANGAVAVNVFNTSGGQMSQVGSVLPGFSATDFRLTGGNFVRALGGDGTAGSPYQLADIYGVQGMRTGTMLGKAYTLANNIDASGTSAWNSGLGFNPIGSDTGPFTGSLNGQNYSISGLFINRPSQDYVGLFGNTSAAASVANVLLSFGSITGKSRVGAVVGNNSGQVNSVTSTASVFGQGGVGGLVGENNGSVSNSYATGNVVITGQASATSTDAVAGGLVGTNQGAISRSYATGSVKFVRSNSANNAYLGGLVGSSSGSISDSFALGNVYGNWFGTDPGSGFSAAGGLVGSSNSSITNSFATGYVTANNYRGGLLGMNNTASVTNSFWNTDTSGIAAGTATTGSGSPTLGTGKSTAELMNPNSALLTDTALASDSSSSSTWVVSENAGVMYPWLRATHGQNGPQVFSGTLDEKGTNTQITQVNAAKNGMFVGQSSMGANGFVYGMLRAGSFAENDKLLIWSDTVFNTAAKQSTALVQTSSGNNTGLNWVAQGLTLRNNGTTTLNASSLITGTGSLDSSRGVIGYSVNNGDVTLGNSTVRQLLLAGSGSGGIDITDCGCNIDTIAANMTAGNLSYSQSSALTVDSVGGIHGINNSGGSVTLQTTGATELTINQAVTTTGDNASVSLGAGNNLKIYSRVSVQGNSGVALKYGATGDYDLGLVSGSFTGKINISGTGGFSTQQGSDAVVNYTVINSLGAAGSSTGTDLQGINGDLSGNYVLGSDIDASATSGWNSGLGFRPIGNGDSPFSGRFSGLGHTISNLNINRPSENNVGLFSTTSSTASLTNVALMGGTIDGNTSVGALVGENSGLLGSVYSYANVFGHGEVGGLVGRNYGNMSNSHARGAVTGSMDFVGGLVGNNAGFLAISNSSATGNVSGNSFVGGLVGYTGTNISNSHAIGAVTGSGYYIGGLVGFSEGNISGSFASGAVGGTGVSVGGLLGYSSGGVITSSQASGAVAGTTNVGGLLGYNNGGSVSFSSASGEVTGTENIGGLVGYSGGGFVESSFASGAVTGSTGVGGLVGYNSGGSVSNSSASGAILGTGSFVGGLLGYTSGGSVNNSYASGAVSSTGDFVGGLVGANFSNSNGNGEGNVSSLVEATSFDGFSNFTISNSYATGNVSGNNNVGGLVGQNGGSISGSHATGTVTSTGNNVGGLVGANFSAISQSYATGDVSGTINVGGLVGLSSYAGFNDLTISNSYAKGNVSGTTKVGGLVGEVASGNPLGLKSIENSYATGNVSANRYGGGLVGYNAGSISTSYADADITGTGSDASELGGLVGFNSPAGDGDTPGTVTSSYWNSSKYATSAGGSGLSDTQMKQSGSFVGWDLARTGGSNAIWRVYEGNTTPLLRSFLSTLTLANAPDLTLTYNATAQSAGNTPFDPIVMGSAATGINAGFYNGYYSTQQGYDLIGGNLTIDPASLTMTVINLSGSRVYDGTNIVNANIFSLSGLLGGQDLNLTGQGTVADKHVGVDKPVSLGTLALGNGNNGLAANYTLVNGTHKATITPASVTMSTNSVSKTYDGSTSAAGTAVVTSGTLFGSDSLSGGSFAFTDKNAGNNKTVAVSGVNISDGNDGDNYSVSYASNTASTITPASLTVSTSNVSKTYDGSTSAAGTAVVTSGTLYGSDSLTGGSFAFTDKNAGSNKTVAVSGVNISDGNDGANYSVSYASNTASTITPASLTVSTSNVSKTYDGSTSAAGTAVITAGTLFGSDSLSGGSFAFTDKNAGSNKTVAVSGVNISDGNDGANYSVSYTSNTASTITPASLTISTNNVSKTYDGSTSAAGTAVVTSGTLFGSDSLTGGSFAFTDKNAGNNKTVSVSGVNISDGNDGANYSVSYASNTASTITQLASVAWTGAGNDNKWSTAANWAGGAIPDFANVAAVSIPANATVNFDSQGLSATLSSLSSQGRLNVSNGVLSVGSLSANGTLNTSILRATGGKLVVYGSLSAADYDASNNSVNFNYSSQNPYSSRLTDLSLGFAGDANISSAMVASNSISLTAAGRIVQGGEFSGTALSAPRIELAAGTGIGQAQSRLQLATNSLSASTTSGPLQLHNTPSSAVTMSLMRNTSADATYYSQDGNALNIVGNITSSGGAITIDPPSSITMAANSSINSGGGDIDLQATGDMSLTSVNAGGGAMKIQTPGRVVASQPIANVSFSGGGSFVNGPNTETSTRTSTEAAIAVAVTTVLAGNSSSSVSPSVLSTSTENTQSTGTASSSKSSTSDLVTLTVAGSSISRTAQELVAPSKSRSKQLMCRRSG